MFQVDVLLVALVSQFILSPAQGQLCFPVSTISTGLVNYAACTLMLSNLEPIVQRQQFANVSLYGSWMIVTNMKFKQFKVDSSGCRVSAHDSEQNSYQVNLSTLGIKLTADVHTRSRGQYRRRGKLKAYDPRATADVALQINEKNGCASPEFISCNVDHKELNLKFSSSSMQRLETYILPAIWAQIEREACEAVSNYNPL